MDRLPECYISVFGGLKIGAIIGPLFSAFGPEPVNKSKLPRVRVISSNVVHNYLINQQ